MYSVVEPEYFELPHAVAVVVRSDTYTVLFREQWNTEIIRDNLGLMHFKNKKTQIKLELNAYVLSWV